MKFYEEQEKSKKKKRKKKQAKELDDSPTKGVPLAEAREMLCGVTSADKTESIIEGYKKLKEMYMEQNTEFQNQ